MENKESHPVGEKDAVEVVGLVLEDDGDNGGWLATSCEEKGNTEPEDMGVDISMEITEDDASIVYEARTPAGWGLTVNNYVDLTSAIQ